MPAGRRIAGALLAAIAAVGCGRDATGPKPQGAPAVRGWTRHDLLRDPPDTVDAVRVQTRLLGQGVELDARGPDHGERRRVAGQIEALETSARSDLRWTVALGEDPFLSYVPLSTSEAGCRRTYRVRAIRPDGSVTELHEHPAGEPARFGPDAVEISLDRIAGRSIDLVLRLDVEGEACAAEPAVWGRPAVYSRRRHRDPPGSAERPNVVLIGLDTVRADALGAWGREPSVTPALDRLARGSDVWLGGFSSFNITNPSFASILTGLYGKNHGVYSLRTPLGDEHTTLAELFSAAGYDTGAILSARHLGDAQSGLRQGFELYRLPPSQYAAGQSVDHALDWIAERRRRFFLWLHLFDPHTPHTPPRSFARGWRPLEAGFGPIREPTPFREPGEVEYDHPYLGGHRQLYAAEVAYLDRHVGRLLEFLDSRGFAERTLIALVADHGENLGEHGIRYRHSGLWDTTTHVPLMIRWPGTARAGRRISGLVQTVDLFPTLLAAAGLEAPPADGVDLRRLEGGGRPRIFAEASQQSGAMIRTPTHLLFLALEARPRRYEAGPHLYDLRSDPAQETNVAGMGLAVEAELREALERWLKKRRAGELSAVPLGEEEIRRLRSLGYVDSE